MALVSLFFRIVVGVIFGVGCIAALSPALAFINLDSSDTTMNIIFAVIFGGVMLLGAFAPTIRRAFGRGFLALGAAVFALPLSTMLLSGRAAMDVIDNSGAGNEGFAAIGAGAAGLAITGVATFVGFFAGAILLLIGLVLSLGGRR